MVFPHPKPGAEIRGIEYDPSVPPGRLLFLLSTGEVIGTALDGTGAASLFTFHGGPAASPTGYSGLSRREGILYTLLGPGYDCLVGFQASDGAFVLDANLSGTLGLPVEQSIGPHITADRVLVGIGETQSQEISDVFQLNFVGATLTDAHVNMPLSAPATTLVTDIEYVAGQGLLAVDANNRRLCLLDADFDKSPLIESIAPKSGPEAGGTVVTLGAKNLRSQEDTRVEVGGVEVAILTYQDGPDPSRKVLTFSTPAHAAGGVRVEVITSDGRSFADPGFTYGAGASFVRANADGQGGVDISDAQFTLNYLFLGGPTPPCLEAADANDDGAVDLTDATFTLSFLFLGGPTPPTPFPNPGPDPTADGLGC